MIIRREFLGVFARGFSSALAGVASAGRHLPWRRVPPAATLPFLVRPQDVVVDGVAYRPYAIVIGGTLLTCLDTPEKVAGIQKPLPADIRHATIARDRPYDRIALHDYGTPESGPVHGTAVVGPGEVTDVLARVAFDVVVGWTPESIADLVRQQVLDAFRNADPYAHGRRLDAPTPLVAQA
jgi:hypothetical protein